ncbi:DUF6056 family protein, partial [Paucilactobacillus suebicus]|uniref:DUF6056 family protein n=1 Tax=Paucilactobacillus suebicus TaxID=152335 RepID=UPI000AEECC7A
QVLHFNFKSGTYLILKISVDSNKPSFFNKTISYVLVILILFDLVPNFSQMFLWRAGSENYLWTIVIDLIFIYLYESDKQYTNRFLNILHFIFMIVLGFVMGGTNENTVGGIIIIVTFIHFAKKIRGYKYFAVVASFFGYALLLLSPGDSRRGMLSNPGFYKLSPFRKLILNIPQINEHVVSNMSYLIIIFLVLLAFSVFTRINKNKLVDAIVWLLSGLCVWYVLAFSPGSPQEEQTYFGGFIIITISVVKLFSLLLQNSVIGKQLCISILFVLLFFTCVNLSNGVIDAYRTNQSINSRNSYILEQKKEGKTNIKVNKLSYSGHTKYSLLFVQFDLTKDPSYWVNKATAHRFGVNSVYVDEK